MWTYIAGVIVTVIILTGAGAVGVPESPGAVLVSGAVALLGVLLPRGWERWRVWQRQRQVAVPQQEEPFWEEETEPVRPMRNGVRIVEAKPARSRGSQRWRQG